ncbi:hypothetical protein L195_g004117, partial [Trifolium pratense]
MCLSSWLCCVACNSPGPTTLGGPGTATSRSSPPPSLVEFLSSVGIEPRTLGCYIAARTDLVYWVWSSVCVDLVLLFRENEVLFKEWIWVSRVFLDLKFG